MNLESLKRPEGPWLHRLVTSESELCDIVWSLDRSPSGRTVARIVRGQKARTVPALFDEFAAALQFPYYFGENWNAFDECFCDLEWLAASTVLVFVSNGARLLDHEPEESLRTFLETAERAGRESGEAQAEIRAVHVILHATSADRHALTQRLKGTNTAWDVLS